MVVVFAVLVFACLPQLLAFCGQNLEAFVAPSIYLGSR